MSFLLMVPFIRQPTFFNLDDTCGCSVHSPHGRTFPTALDPLYCNRYEIRKYAEDAWRNNIRYLGVCCGAAPMHIREVAEAMGKIPPASRYSENMEKHFMYGSDDSLPEHITSYGDKAQIHREKIISFQKKIWKLRRDSWDSIRSRFSSLIGSFH